MKKGNILNLPLLLMVFALLITNSCKKDDTNVAPGALTLIDPTNAAADIALDATLSWQAAIDPNGDAVIYDVYFGTDASPVTVASTGQTTVTYIPTLAANTTYYWKVVAKDPEGETSTSAVWSFTTLNNVPGDVTLTAPANTATNVALDATLTWQAAIDPDGDAVTYDVYFGIDATPVSVTSTGQTTVTYIPTLAANTTYYWKVVAKDGKGGISESAVWSFTTDLIAWSDATHGTFTDTRDNKVYDVIKIGTQTWFAENLAYEISGKEIIDGTEWVNNAAYDAWCYYDNNKATYGSTYGVLYQWEAAKAACPAGWHLPSDDEWTTLSTYLEGEDVAGGKLKEEGTSHWNSPNTGATNSSEFTALPGGAHYIFDFYDIGSYGSWWSSTEGSSTSAYIRFMYYYRSYIRRDNNYNKKVGFSVRCLRGD